MPNVRLWRYNALHSRLNRILCDLWFNFFAKIAWIQPMMASVKKIKWNFYSKICSTKDVLSVDVFLRELKVAITWHAFVFMNSVMFVGKDGQSTTWAVELNNEIRHLRGIDSNREDDRKKNKTEKGRNKLNWIIEGWQSDMVQWTISVWKKFWRSQKIHTLMRFITSKFWTKTLSWRWRSRW